MEQLATVLLVEDDPGDQILTTRALEDWRLKVDLRIVQDGEEALDYLFRRNEYESSEKAPRPDLVLLDLNLPRLNGKEVLAQMKRCRETATIPVVALTTSNQHDEIMRTYELGATSYIVKPIDMTVLLRTLKKLGHYWFKVVVLSNEDRAA